MLHALAQYVRGAESAMITDWMIAVRQDQTIPSAKQLDDTALRDHLDCILLRLADHLDHRSLAPSGDTNGALHGRSRWDEHYRVDEVVREIALLRESFCSSLKDFLQQHPHFSTEELLSSCQIIHRYFDDLSSDSIACYMRERHTHMERTAHALGLLNQTLEEANREYAQVDSTRRRTMRTMAHEMAASVNALGLGVSYLTECELPQERQEGQRLISRTVEHLREMLGQLADVTQVEPALERPHITQFEVEPLFAYLTSIFRPLAERKGLEFRAVLDPGLQRVYSDENKVQRMAINLLSNAIKYCPEGHVALTMCALDNECWVVEVADTGTGIPAGDQERIFQEFERLPQHAEQPGLGLGLAIVRCLAHRLGGTVAIESEEGLGSCFRVSLPREGI